MKIAVVSDSHDHVWNMRKLIRQATEAGIQTMIHCGDLISAFMLEELDSFNGDIHLIFGNNTGDQVLLMKRLKSRPNITFHGWFGRVVIDGLRLAFVHAPDMADAIARSGEFDMVFYGHTHLWRQEEINGTVLLNPGEIMGKKEPAGWAMIDTATGAIEQVLIG